MKSPVAYGNQVMFGAVDWNYAAGAPVRRGKSVDDLGDAGWARERERIAHLQHIQQLHQLQLQQQQVGYPAYGVVPPGHPQGPVMVPSPGDPLPAPGWPAPPHGGMMVPVSGPMPPAGHVPAPWPVQWVDQAQVRHDNVSQQPSWQYNDQHKTALKDSGPQGKDVYFHPGSQDGHIDVRVSEWKGKHCFYQGPEDHGHQDNRRVPQEKDHSDFRTQEGYSKLEEERIRKDNWVRENDRNSERYDYRSSRDLEEYDHRDKYRYRDHYDRKNTERYSDQEEQSYESRKRRNHDDREHDRYNSEYEDYHDRKETYDRRDNYRDSDHYYDRDREYYDSKDSHRHREKEYYQSREEDRYYDEQKRKDRLLWPAMQMIDMTAEKITTETGMTIMEGARKLTPVKEGTRMTLNPMDVVVIRRGIALSTGTRIQSDDRRAWALRLQKEGQLQRKGALWAKRWGPLRPRERTAPRIQRRRGKFSPQGPRQI